MGYHKFLAFLSGRIWHNPKISTRFVQMAIKVDRLYSGVLELPVDFIFPFSLILNYITLVNARFQQITSQKHTPRDDYIIDVYGTT